MPPLSVRTRPAGPDRPPVDDALWRARRRELIGMAVYGAGSVVAAILGSFTVSYGSTHDYAALRVPGWQLAHWPLALLWLVAYAGIALAAFLIWRHGGIRRNWPEIGLYALGLALSMLWRFALDVLAQPALAVGAGIALVAAAVATMIAFARRDRRAAVYYAPFFVWTGYLLSLSIGFVALN